MSRFLISIPIESWGVAFPTGPWPVHVTDWRVTRWWRIWLMLFHLLWLRPYLKGILEVEGEVTDILNSKQWWALVENRQCRRPWRGKSISWWVWLWQLFSKFVDHSNKVSVWFPLCNDWQLCYWNSIDFTESYWLFPFLLLYSIEYNWLVPTVIEFDWIILIASTPHGFPLNSINTLSTNPFHPFHIISHWIPFGSFIPLSVINAFHSFWWPIQYFSFLPTLILFNESHYFLQALWNLIVFLIPSNLIWITS